MLTPEKKAELERRIRTTEAEMAAAKTELYSVDGGCERLGWLSWALFGYLITVVIGSTAWAAIIICIPYAPLAEFQLAAASGILGAALSGLISLNQRVANGWESEDGARTPDPAEKKERFNRRLSGGFIARPFLGLVTGILVLTGAHLGLIASVVVRDPDARVFFCLLGGFFSKTLLDWLKDTFKSILGMK